MINKCPYIIVRYSPTCYYEHPIVFKNEELPKDTRCLKVNCLRSDAKQRKHVIEAAKKLKWGLLKKCLKFSPTDILYLDEKNRISISNKSPISLTIFLADGSEKNAE